MARKRGSRRAGPAHRARTAALPAGGLARALACELQCCVAWSQCASLWQIHRVHSLWCFPSWDLAQYNFGRSCTPSNTQRREKRWRWTRRQRNYRSSDEANRPKEAAAKLLEYDFGKRTVQDGDRAPVILKLRRKKNTLEFYWSLKHVTPCEKRREQSSCTRVRVRQLSLSCE